jgi:hypothetical protein
MDRWGVSAWLNCQLKLGYDAIIRFAILSMGEHRVVDILMGMLRAVGAYVAVAWSANGERAYSSATG